MIMNSTFGNLFSHRQNVPRATKRALTALIDTDFAQSALAAAEQQSLADRKDLNEKITQLAEAYTANVAKPAKKRLDAQQAYEKSVQAMHSAHKAWMQAESELYSFDYSYQAETHFAERELLETADSRLAEMLTILSQLDDDGRNRVHYSAVSERTMFGTKLKHFNNLIEIQSARAVLLDCMTRCREMQLRAVSFKDVSTALAAMCALLVDILRTLSLQAPIIKDGEVVNPSRL